MKESQAEDTTASAITERLRAADAHWSSFAKNPQSVAMNAVLSNGVTQISENGVAKIMLIDGCLAEWLAVKCDAALWDAMDEFSLCGLADDHPIADHTGRSDMGSPFSDGLPILLSDLVAPDGLEPLNVELPSEDVWFWIADEGFGFRGKPFCRVVLPHVWDAMLRYFWDVIDLADKAAAERFNDMHNVDTFHTEPYRTSVSALGTQMCAISDQLQRGSKVEVFRLARPEYENHLFDIVPLDDGDLERCDTSFGLSTLYPCLDEVNGRLERGELIVINAFAATVGKLARPLSSLQILQQLWLVENELSRYRLDVELPLVVGGIVASLCYGGWFQRHTARFSRRSRR